MAIRVLLADDHEIIRSVVGALFKRNPQLELVGEATDGQQVTAMAEELLPDVVVMDFSMPGLTGNEATRIITARHPQVKIVALSMHTDSSYVSEMKSAGASGYVAKEIAYDTLVTAIETVHEGGTFFPTP